MFRNAGGLALGLLGVLAFSLTFPATVWAERSFHPVTVGLGRAALAAVLAVGVLRVRRDPLFVRGLTARLSVVVAGVIVGFPLMTTLALHRVPSAHAAVLVGLLPAATAGAAVLRSGERPSGRYWLTLGAGLVAVLAFAVVQGAGALRPADGYLLAAVAFAGFGYAEGGALAREYGGYRVICWALVIAVPVTVPAMVASVLLEPSAGLRADAVVGFLYVTVVSMFLGFFAWYAGLARGGIAEVERLQLTQPVLTLGWSVLLLHEHVDRATVFTAAIVLLTVTLGRRAQVQRPATKL